MSGESSGRENGGYDEQPVVIMVIKSQMEVIETERRRPVAVVMLLL